MPVGIAPRNEAIVTTYLLFGLFAATLLGIAKFHKLALPIALGGLGCVLLVKMTMTPFDLGAHLHHESSTIVNLGGLLLGFAVLANYFERSNLAEKLTEVLPAGRMGAFLLLVLVAVMSSVLDNIAAALIGGAAAMTLFQRKVHIGYLAAIVAASNAGGAGSESGLPAARPHGPAPLSGAGAAGAADARGVPAAVVRGRRRGGAGRCGGPR